MSSIPISYPQILAIPAISLTMSAGLLFGSIIGIIIVSISGTVAASAAFLIARYFARDRILKLVEGNNKFLAIDKAIGENGFKVVTLLRLSPLLPFSLGNYLYGLTSVKFVPYVLGRAIWKQLEENICKIFEFWTLVADGHFLWTTRTPFGRHMADKGHLWPTHDQQASL
ncbi:TVP38/TMEM64 family membrane protein slr0305, partial [Camellia lanceoleosa]